MPTYEYRCSKGHHFELFQRISEEPVKTCPECGASAERLLSGSGLIFKGSGFYVTDYRSDTYKKAAQADSGAPSGDSGSKSDSAGKSSSTSSESKDSSGSTPSSGGTSKTE